MSETPSPTHIGWLPYIVAATFFMEYLDTTVIATALPQMAHSFGVGPNALSLGMTAYMLALAIFIPVSGWVADRYGSRTVFAAAIIVFTLASVLCGLSNNVVEFTAARLLQGVGGAMMVPVGRLIVVRSTDKARLMQAISTITWPAIAAPVVGPPIGGFITTYASWRWIFLLNVPFGIAALAAVAALVPNLHGSERKPLDLGGLALSGTALTALLYGAELGSQPESDPWLAAAIVAAGCACGWLAIMHARGQRHPLIDFSTLRIPTFSVTVVTGSLTRIGIGAVPYLMPLLFQIGFGLSAFKSGLLLLASALGNLGMKALTTRILRRFGFRIVSM
jgi:EmrB/QacA subfamily drug resistance transporter